VDAPDAPDRISSPQPEVEQLRAISSISIVLLLLAGAAFSYSQTEQAEQPTGLHRLQGDTFVRAVNERMATSSGDQKMVASAIVGNYTETRTIARNWSGLYWGFAWASAALSALAGVLLKLESWFSEKTKKDVAAIFAVAAAILVTVSTGGEFQRKWQANRIASAEIEHLGYEFLASTAPDAKAIMSRLGEILLRRHQSIVGRTEPNTGSKPNGP
jgi:hypothetical protein